MSLRIAHKTLLRRLRNEAARDTLTIVARHSRIPYMTLFDIINDSKPYRGTIKTWLRIEDYYQNKKKK